MTYSGNYWLNGSQQETNAKYIWLELRKKGWSKEAIAGLLGNTQVESSHNPGIWEGLNASNTSRGFGLVQYTPGSMMVNEANKRGRNPGDIDLQIELIDKDFFRHWIPTSAYNFSYSQFKSSTRSPEELAQAFLRNFERPANQVQPARSDHARRWFNKFKNLSDTTPKTEVGGRFLKQPNAKRFDESKSLRASSVSIRGWQEAWTNQFRIDAADPYYVTGDYIDAFLGNYYRDSPLRGYGKEIKAWSDYYGVPVGLAMGMWAKETTFGRGHPGKVDHNFGCMIAETAPQYPAVVYAGRRWVKFPSVSVGIGEWFKYIRHKYIEPGAPFKSSNYGQLLDYYSPKFENNQSEFKNIMWGVLKAFGYDTTDVVSKINYSKASDDVRTTNPHVTTNSNATITKQVRTDSIEKTIKWMEDKVKEPGTYYSQANRYGPKGYDCSSAVFTALKHGGFPITTIGNTDTLFSMEGKLLKPIKRSEIKRGDVFVSGYKGASGGDYGHTGFALNETQAIHCSSRFSGGFGISSNADSAVSAFGRPVYWYRVEGAYETITINGIDETINRETTTIEKEEKVYINDINNGKEYIVQPELLKTFGLNMKTVEYNEIEDKIDLKQKGLDELEQQTYDLESLQLSFVQLDRINANYKKIKRYDVVTVSNDQLGIDVRLRVEGRIFSLDDDIVGELDMGRRFNTLSDWIKEMQRG